MYESRDRENTSSISHFSSSETILPSEKSLCSHCADRTNEIFLRWSSHRCFPGSLGIKTGIWLKPTNPSITLSEDTTNVFLWVLHTTIRAQYTDSLWTAPVLQCTAPQPNFRVWNSLTLHISFLIIFWCYSKVFLFPLKHEHSLISTSFTW